MRRIEALVNRLAFAIIAAAFIGSRKLVKPVPDGIDEWTHPYHGPDNNPQSNDKVIVAPYLTQYLAERIEALESADGRPPVLLIDEIDKADLEFPNDLLNELDNMTFIIPETGREVSAKVRPMVVITSNNEKELPDAFLRRCVFHYIEFPDPPLMKQIVDVHHPNLDTTLLDQVLIKFYWLRGQNELRKKPSTSELIDWISALLRSGIDQGQLEAHIPFLGSLLKNEQDVHLFEQLVFLDRRTNPQ